VVATIMGQGLLLGSVPLLEYAAVVWLAFHLFVLAYEEPTLERQFGEAYGVYRAHVGRWWPRATAFDASVGRAGADASRGGGS
jgi:protein-S-isoprenylcysteine O-methyltransferase Ste14